MTTQIHGHEVMQMMLELDQSFTRESLRQAIQDRFGGEARFFTCSAENMTPDELIDFLAERGKFVERDRGFNTQADMICNH
jgi:probable metal-binding protein